MRYFLSFIQHPQSRLALFGTMLEYYDYALYGFCAGILAQQLFPQLDANGALIQTYLLFCAGSLAKPLGSLLFGWIGDLYGRRLALRWSMLGIVLPTLAIVTLPSGLESSLAMAVVLGARIFQGIFIAGESDGVRIRLYEDPLQNKFPFISNAIIGLSCYIGIFLASQGATIAKQFPDYWRVPFLIGGALGISLILARRHITESPDFKKPQNFWGQPNYRGLLATIMVCGAVGGTYHLFFVYQPTYWTSILLVTSATQAQILITICLACYIPGLLLAAFLCEKYRPEWVLISGIIMALLLTPFLAVSTLPNLPLLCLISLSLSFMHSPGYVLLMGQFPITSRYRHISLGHSSGSLLMSGTAPLLASILWQKWHNPVSFAGHFLILLGIGLGGIVILLQSRRNYTTSSQHSKKQDQDILTPSHNLSKSNSIEMRLLNK